MDYYLVQHGSAYSKEDDPNRGLTEEGITETKKMAQLLLSKKSTIDAIYHSGKKRAEQTAVIFAKALGLEDKVKSIDGINPMDDVKTFALVLRENTLVVSHLPFLEKLTNYLVINNSETKTDVVEYSNSHVVCLTKDIAGKYRVDWIL
jgi:phosphohistidine phosphatase